MRRRAFTLIELMVILAIIALVSSITFSAFHAVSNGNKRSSCQSNLAQIYSAARQYSRDYDGQWPYRNVTAYTPAQSTPAGGLGLWALYTYPALPGDTLVNSACDNSLVPPRYPDRRLNAALAGYIKSTKFFHCPLDNFTQTVSYTKSDGSCGTMEVSSNQLDFDPGDGVRRTNPNFLSYQGSDVTPLYPAVDTYSSLRFPDEKRQLEYFRGTVTATTTPYRRTPDATVVTWCRFHRQLDGNGNTIGPGTGGDNVLFADGSIQSVPLQQAVTNRANDTGTCVSWHRVPLTIQDQLSSPSTCTP